MGYRLEKVYYHLYSGNWKIYSKKKFKSMDAYRQGLSVYVQEYSRIEKSTYITSGSSI